MQPIGNLLPSLLRRVSDDPDTILAFLRELWPQIAGSEFSRRSRPVAFGRKELILEISDEAWLRQSRYFSNMLVESVNRFWGVNLVEKIQFRLHQD